MTAGVAARFGLSLPPVVIASSDSDAATSLIGAVFRRLPRLPSGLTRGSLSLLAMTPIGFADASPVIMRTAGAAGGPDRGGAFAARACSDDDLDPAAVCRFASDGLHRGTQRHTFGPGVWGAPAKFHRS